MTAQELRLGNIFYRIDRSNKVHLPIEIPMKVLEINMFEVLAYFTYENPANMPSIPVIAMKDISPIELSPDILLKAGFKEILNGDYWMHEQLGEKITLYLPYFSMNYYIRSVLIKYLHTLQNFFYALTGEELLIQL
jgi:hypothetical protein